MRRTRATLTTLLIAVVALSGCVPVTTEGSAGSRARLYDSLGDLADDSALVITATATGEQRVDADESRTSTIVSVDDVLRGGSLDAGSRVEVWQMGTPESPGPTSFMRVDESYLLFLTAADIDGVDPGTYWVTGGTAGVWGVVDGNYARLASEGDDLPERVTLDQVRESVR